MNLSTKPLPPIIVLSVLFSALFSTSCSEIDKAAKRPITEGQACNRLTGLIADHPDHFKKYKKSLRQVRNLNTWSAEKVFPMAENCQVWEWSTGLYSYICNWEAEDGLKSAKTDYLEGSRIIQNCLGSAWMTESDNTRSGGQRTVYSKQGSKTLVSIRYFQESRSIFGKWFTVITIGDDSNLKAKIN